MPKTQNIFGQKVLLKRTDAKICEGELLKALKSQQVAINNGNICFDELMGLWLKKAKKCYSNSTYRAYEWYAEKYLMPVFHGKMMRKITAKIIQKFADGFSEKYSAETTNKCLNILSDLFQYGMEYACINYNPVFKVKRKKVTVKEIGTWRESHIQKFLAYEKVKASRYYELLILSFSTGLRPSEVCGLADWMLKGNTLYIERGYDQYNAVSNLKTQRSHRRLILPHDLVEILANRIQRQELESHKKGYVHNDFLFKQATGKPVNPNAYSKCFKRLLRLYNAEQAEKLPDVTLYEATRHSFGTNMVVYHKQPTSIISSIMGNSERVLQTRYIHPDDNVKAETLLEYGQSIIVKA